MSERVATWVPVAVALITVAGAVAVALISQGRLASDDTVAQTLPVVAPTEQADVVSNSPVAITGVLIGSAKPGEAVSTVKTRFGPRDDVAITVRYDATADVVNFPVRLSVRITSGFGNGVQDHTTDIAKPGKNTWTFHVKPKDGWIGSEQFLWVRVNDRDAYSQQFTVGPE